MKIVHIIDYFQPQLGYQESELAREQAHAGHEVTVLTSDRYYPYSNYEKSFRKVLGKRIVGEKEEKRDGYKIIRIKPLIEVGQFTLIPQFKSKLDEIKPELVIHHNLLAPNVFFTIQSKHNFKLIVDHHTGKYNSTPISIFKKVYLYIWHKLIFDRLKKRARIITTGKSEDDYLKLLVGDVKTEIIPLGADTKKFKPNVEARKKIRRELNIPDNAVVFVTSGKFTSQKQTLEIIQSFKKVSNQNMFLMLIGKSEDESYQAVIETEVDSNFVKLNGFKSNKELAEYFAAADVAVWLGRRSISFYEALASGLAIILSKDDFAEDVVQNNNGILVSNLNELELAMTKLVTETTLRDTMKKNSRKIAEDKFSWEKISKEFTL